MADAMTASHWCHMCRQRVNPVVEPELECPFCDCGFVEEIAIREAAESEDVGSERAISSWASVMMEMMGDPPRRPRSRRFPRIEDDDDDSDLERELESILWRRRLETDEDAGRTRMDEGDDDSDGEHELESILQRRRQSSAIHQLLRSLRDDFRSESDEPEIERERERDGESLVMISTFNESVILEGTFESDQNPSRESDGTTIGASIGDYFVGPGLEMLFQHLAENDPNCYGTPPAQKEAVDALPTVTIEENINCPVCLEDVKVGMQAKELPCNHKFHKDCIFPWLELHSSCPVCRFQLPADESKGSSGLIVESREGRVGSGGSIRRSNRSRTPSSLAFNGRF